MFGLIEFGKINVAPWYFIKKI